MTFVEFHNPGVDALQSVLSSNALRVAALAAEARQILTAGLLDTAAGSDLDQLADFMQVIADDLAKLRDSVIAADQLSLADSLGILADMNRILAAFALGGLGPVSTWSDEALRRLAQDDPEALAAAWSTLSAQQQKAVAVAVTVTPTQNQALQGVVKAYKKGLNSSDLEALYQAVALTKAGISEDWNPDDGFNAVNQANSDAVYAYYARLYASDPDTFLWAGMGAEIGPAFVAGIQDMDVILDLMRDPKVRVALEAQGLLPKGLPTITAEYSAGEVEWFRNRMIRMQKEIFLDMGAKFEAFLDGGADQVARLVVDEPIGQRTVTNRAFTNMENGTNLDSAAEDLANREQRYVISDDWDQIRAHGPFGLPLTYLMTMIGQPSIPGAQSYADAFPVEFTVPVGVNFDQLPIPSCLPQVTGSFGGSAEIGTPLAAGNISYRDDRWKLALEDTLPAYTTYAHEHQSDSITSALTPASVRAEQYRMDPVSVLKTLTDFDVESIEIHDTVGVDAGCVDDAAVAVYEAGTTTVNVVVGVADNVADGIGDAVVDRLVDVVDILN